MCATTRVITNTINIAIFVMFMLLTYLQEWCVLSLRGQQQKHPASRLCETQVSCRIGQAKLVLCSM